MLRFMDSFDHYTHTNLLRKWSYHNGTLGTDIQIGAYGRRGSNGLRLTGGTVQVGRRMLDDALQSVWYVGAAIYVESVGSEFTLCNFVGGEPGGGITQCDIRVTATGQLRVTRNATVIATSTNTLSSATWYYVEIYVSIANSGACEIRVDGSSANWVNVSSVDIQFNTNPGVTSIEFNGNSLSPLRMDDLYICDGQTPGLSGFLGDVRVDCLRPNGNGFSSGLDGSDGNSTDNYLLVDETQSDDDSTYVESSVPPDDDLYEFGALPHTPTDVRAVQLLADCKRVGTSTRTGALLTRVGGTTYATGGEFQMGTSYAYGRQIRESNPAGGSPDAFSVSDIAAAQFGVRVAA